jgi:type IV pilus assembly protein PilA
MILKNKKGLSLTELLIAVSLIGLISPLIFTIFVFGIEDYATTTKYVDQQYSVMEVIRYIRQDVEAAKRVTYVLDDSANIKEVIFEFPDESLRFWKFGSFHETDDDIDTVNGLGLKNVKEYDERDEVTGVYSFTDSVEYTGVIDRLDLTQSKFDVDTFSGDGPTQLILTIKPEQLNKTKYKGRNINENIITEFSVRYKLFGKYTEGD